MHLSITGKVPFVSFNFETRTRVVYIEFNISHTKYVVSEGGGGEEARFKVISNLN